MSCTAAQPLNRLQHMCCRACFMLCAAHASNLAALDVSADGRALVACGADNLARQTIALWDIQDVRSTGKVSRGWDSMGEGCPCF